MGIINFVKNPNPPAEENPQDEGEESKVVLSKSEHEKLIEQAKELESTREKLLRNAADYDNARKRLAKEREEFVRYSQEKILRDLLPVLDNFERALAHSESLDPKLVAGVRLIGKQLLDTLTQQGLKRLESEGQPFDPHVHEAVDEVEEEGPEGIVVQEILPGYILHERVLRPAKVRIRVKPRGNRKFEEKEEELT